eukprot:m.102009 g.102009  ORF g.102009 m.102009 type:complete len:200 (-) comp8809_c0_seq1:9-608(-)
MPGSGQGLAKILELPIYTDCVIYPVQLNATSVGGLVAFNFSFDQVCAIVPPPQLDAVLARLAMKDTDSARETARLLAAPRATWNVTLGLVGTCQAGNVTITSAPACYSSIPLSGSSSKWTATPRAAKEKITAGVFDCTCNATQPCMHPDGKTCSSAIGSLCTGIETSNCQRVDALFAFNCSDDQGTGGWFNGVLRNRRA